MDPNPSSGGHSAKTLRNNRLYWPEIKSTSADYFFSSTSKGNYRQITNTMTKHLAATSTTETEWLSENNLHNIPLQKYSFSQRPSKLFSQSVYKMQSLYEYKII